MTFGERIQSERQKKKLTKSELSKLIGVHYSQVGRYERDQANPGADVLKKIANALDITTDYLMNGTEEELATQKISDKKLINQFQKITSFSEENKNIIIKLIDAFVLQEEMKQRLVNS